MTSNNIQQTQTLVSTKIHAVALFNFSILSYIVLALIMSSAVTHLSNKTLIFHDLQGPTIKFHDFPGLENEIIVKVHDFPGFPWPVQTWWFIGSINIEKSVIPLHWRLTMCRYCFILIRPPRYFSWSIAPILQVQMLAIWYSTKVSIFNNNNNIIFILGDHLP